MNSFREQTGCSGGPITNGIRDKSLCMIVYTLSNHWLCGTGAWKFEPLYIDGDKCCLGESSNDKYRQP